MSLFLSRRWELIHPREARGACDLPPRRSFLFPPVSTSQNRGATRVPNAIKISATAMFINIFGHFRNSGRGLRACTRGVVTGRRLQPHANFRSSRCLPSLAPPARGAFIRGLTSYRVTGLGWTSYVRMRRTAVPEITA